MMTRDEEEAWALQQLTLSTMDLEQGNTSAAMKKIAGVSWWMERYFGLQDDEKKISVGIPVCICIDDLGWSTCGGECPRHPPKWICECINKCTGCKPEGSKCMRKVYVGKKCVHCSRGEDGPGPRHSAGEATR